MGLIKVDKVNQKFTELKPKTNPTYSSKFYFDRATYRLVKCFLEKVGYSRVEQLLNHRN
jgi:hypothetical protein